MALAPERISIKRRRVDEPVDHLFYQGKKQRITHHIFVRVVANAPPYHKTSSQKQSQTHTTPGIPSVRATAPGDEVKDFHRYRVAHGLQQGHVSELQSIEQPSTKDLSQARRFHLTRDLSTTFRPRSSGNIRNVKSGIRPHLPTFVEKTQPCLEEQVLLHLKPPVDGAVHPTNGVDTDLALQKILSNDGDVTKHQIPTFQKPASGAPKTGRSIYDDPATWNLESDQLADELAALALEMDPVAKAAHLAEIDEEGGLDRMAVDDPNDYIFETYVRLQQDRVSELISKARATSIGYLVIDEEEEELWDQYLRDERDNDDEWDEEDEDSNAEDNPRNEYPDEELSSDDEHGTNAYKYRRYHSDNEQFDDDNS